MSSIAIRRRVRRRRSGSTTDEDGSIDHRQEVANVYNQRGILDEVWCVPVLFFIAIDHPASLYLTGQPLLIKQKSWSTALPSFMAQQPLGLYDQIRNINTNLVK